jgi:hypothetical protein
MNRLMLPVMGTLLLCAQSFCALAADSTSTSATTPTHEQLREQIEAKRDQLSGAASLSKSTQAAPASVQDAPIVTDDAPSQEQQQ